MTDERPPAPPYELRLVGVPDLRDADGTQVDALLAQPKRLALLTRLAFAGQDGMLRQTLLELLWPELDDARARNALRQSLHFLRRHLGASAVLATDEHVVLDAAQVRCDVLALHAAFARGDDEAALAALSGRMADGLHVSGALRFSAWLEGERERLSRAASEAAWRLAQSTEDAGDTAGARRWADRALEVAPADDTTRRRSGALDARLADLADAQARARLTMHAALVDRRPSLPWWRRPGLAWAGAALTVLVVLSGFVVARLNATPPPSPDRLAVLPFTVQAAPQFQYLREGMVDLLAARLDGLPGLHVVDARLALRVAGARGDSANVTDLARRLAAGFTLSGSVTDSAGRLVVSATLFRADGRREGTAHAIAPAESGLFTAVDAVARQLIALRGAGERDHLKELATRTTSSLDALRAWLEGEQAFRAGRYVAATDAFQRAVLLDSTFALAHYRYAVASAYATKGQSDVPRNELPAALRHGARLGAHDRLMVQALFQDWNGSGDSAQRLYRRAMGERPDDADAWFGFADVSFHRGPRSGIGFDAGRAYFEQALVLDSTSLATVVHLGRIAATHGEWARLRDLARRERALRSPSAAPGELAWISAVASGEADTVTAMLAALAGASDDVAADYAWRAATYGGDPAVAVRVLQKRAVGDRPQTTRAATMLALAHFESARARPRDAALWMERARALAPVPALLAEAGILWASTPSPEAVQAARFRLSRWRRSAGMGSAFEEPPNGGTLAFATSQLEMALQAAVGNDSLLARFVAICQRFDGAPVDDRLAADQVNAWGSARLLAMRGDTTGAIALLEKTRVGMYPRGSIIFPGAVGRLERARLLLAQGKHQEALRWLASIHEENAHDAVMLPEVLLLRTRALAALGDRAGAHRSGQQLLRLWRDAEPTEHGRLALVREAMRGETRLMASHASGGSGR